MMNGMEWNRKALKRPLLNKLSKYSAKMGKYQSFHDSIRYILLFNRYKTSHFNNYVSDVKSCIELIAVHAAKIKKTR